MAGIATQWRQLISQDTSTLDRIGARMCSLGLIPPGMPDASFLNVLPMFYPRRSFEDDKWTVYPRKDVLCNHIKLEERSLVEREAVTSTGRQDPGRPSYKEAYASLPKTNIFDVYFRTDYVGPRAPATNPALTQTLPSSNPSFCSVALVTSVNLVVRMRTTVLAVMSSFSASNTMEQVRLGGYLMRLWDATPGSFRSLNRFRPNDLLPDLEQPIESQSTNSLVTTTAATAGGQPASHHDDYSATPQKPPSPPRSDRSVDMLGTTIPSSLVADSSHSDELRKQGDLLSPIPSKNREYTIAAVRQFQRDSGTVSNEFYEPLEEMTMFSPVGSSSQEGRCAQFTSNEWAALLNGVDLGGSLWYKNG